MVIEALVRGEVMTRAEIPDEDLELPGAPWERAAQYRQQVIDLQLLKLHDKIKGYFRTEIQVDYRLIFRSKLHLINETEDNDTANGNRNLPAHGKDEVADPADARGWYGGA